MVGVGTCEPEAKSVVVLVGLGLREPLGAALVVVVVETVNVPAPQKARCRAMISSRPSLRAQVTTVAV